MLSEEMMIYQVYLKQKYIMAHANVPKEKMPLYMRSLGAAMNVISRLDKVSKDVISSNLYHANKDLETQEFALNYESQLETAAETPETFAFGLYNFYSYMAAKIKKDNLYKEFFRFLHKCFEFRSMHVGCAGFNDDVLLAYTELLVEQFEFLKPNRFDYNTMLAGYSTNGEVLLAPDPFPNLDIISEQFMSRYARKSFSEKDFCRFFRKNGINFTSYDDCAAIWQQNDIHTDTINHLLLFSDEYTYDVLPRSPFSCSPKLSNLIYPISPLPSLLDAAKNRDLELPPNGILIHFSDNPVFKTLFLKETKHNDNVYLLYRITFTRDGELSGMINPIAPYIYVPIGDIPELKMFANGIANFVTFCYLAFVKNDPLYKFVNLGKHVSMPNTGPIVATVEPLTGERKVTYATPRKK